MQVSSSEFTGLLDTLLQQGHVDIYLLEKVTAKDRELMRKRIDSYLRRHDTPATIRFGFMVQGKFYKYDDWVQNMFKIGSPIYRIELR